MDKFRKKELTKMITSTKNIWYAWYDWLINYIPAPILKPVGRVKVQIMSLFKTKDYSKPNHVKPVYGGGKKQSKENILTSIRNLFKLKKDNEAIKDRIIRDVITLLNKKK